MKTIPIKPIPMKSTGIVHPTDRAKGRHQSLQAQLVHRRFYQEIQEDNVRVFLKNLFRLKA